MGGRIDVPVQTVEACVGRCVGKPGTPWPFAGRRGHLADRSARRTADIRRLPRRRAKRTAGCLMPMDVARCSHPECLWISDRLRMKCMLHMRTGLLDGHDEE